MIIDKGLKYNSVGTDSFQELPNEHKKVLEWVGKNNSILEIGCHTGNLSKWLKMQPNRITGVDINAKAIELAMEHQVESYAFDIEKDEFHDRLDGQKYDVILLLHVLEHLSNPWIVLEGLQNYLNEEGQIIIGLPNISNAQTRFDIFKGNFNYQEIGVMDKTHLRFFNLKTAKDLIVDSGLEILDYYSPWVVNPLKSIFDHIPILHKVKNIFSDKPSMIFSKNLTDVVMLFNCRIRKQD